MYDVDMTRIDTKLETAFINETEASLTASEVIRLRRYVKSLKEDLMELNRAHLKIVNESVPMTFVRTLVHENDSLKARLAELSSNIQVLEYSGKSGRCPVCFRSLIHSTDCWLGKVVKPYSRFKAS